MVNHNPNLQAAEAAIKVARYNALAQRGLYFPQLTGNSATQQILVANPQQVPPIPTAGPQSEFSLVTNQLTVSFVPDIWGGNVRAVESLDATTEQQLFQLEAAFLTLTSNVVTAAIQEASLRGQIAATQRIIAIEKRLLEILKRQQSLGQAALADVLAQDAALAQAEELLPPLEKQLAQQRDLLTSLAGQYAADEVRQKFDLAHLKLPTNLRVSLPGKLVNQRPDVRAAEANMHSAAAQIGVAIAARLPNITLSANGGSAAFNWPQTFAPGTGFFTLGAAAAAPIFDGLTLYHKQKAAEAALDQAEAQYRATVITAFQNVADALRALQSDAKAMRAARRAEDAAKASLDIVEKQLNEGPGQPARRAECAADLSDRRRDLGADRSQPHLGHGCVVHGAWRQLAFQLHRAGLAPMRVGRSAGARRRCSDRGQIADRRRIDRDVLELNEGAAPYQMT